MCPGSFSFSPCALLLLACTAGAAWCAEDSPADGLQADVLQEVIVQASLRSETVGELPASITVLGSRTLELAGVQHFQDVVGLVPNLNWSAGTSRPRYFQLRGIGELEQFQGAPNTSVGFLIDDIDFSGIGMPAMLLDVEQIEVLRGPQGTAYGANALGGLINVRTRNPRPEFELTGEATAADYGTYGVSGVLGGGIGESGENAFRLVAQRYRSDGFRRNVYLGREDTNGYDESNFRAKVHWHATDHLGVDLTGLFADLDNGYDAFAIDNTRVTHSDDPGRDAQRSAGAAARLEYTGFESFVLHSVTSVADSDIVYSFDGDWGNDLEWGEFAPYDFTSRFLRNRRTWSQDLRAVSEPGVGIGGRASWVAGVYTLHARETNDQLDMFNGELYAALRSRYESANLAAYGQLDVGVTDRTRVSFGARVERRSADYTDSNNLDFSPSETMLGGHLSLTHQLSSTQHLYATLSRGYKAGGFNIGVSIPEGLETFDAEYLWNLETGAKLRSEDGRMEGQVSVFYMRRTDQQVQGSTQLDPEDPLTFVIYTDNAARGENYGIESSLWWRATDRWQLGGSLGVLKTRYIGYRFGDRDLDGREQSHAPEYQLALAAQYRHPLGWLARLDTLSMDDFYFDTSHDERSSPVTLVNMKLGYETRRWAAYAWVRNLFDEDYATRGFFFANEPPDFIEKRYVQPGDPRHVGVTFSYSFY